MSKYVIDDKKLLSKWDYEKNNAMGIDPSKITVSSNKKAWWICTKGHPSYLMCAQKIISQNCGCPVCSNHKVIEGINDFKSNHPELMLDWDYDKNKGIEPSTLSIRSITRVSWKCHVCGYEWKGTVKDATEKEINCPKCSGKQRTKKAQLTKLKNRGCLSDPNVLIDWDYEKNEFLPTDVTPKSSRFAYWKCHICGYKWRAKILNRSNGRGCACCGKRTLVSGINDLATVNPELAKEWHPTKNGDLKPSDVMPGVNKKVWWLCPNGHEYQATLNHRSHKNGTNCPICNSGRQTSFREQTFYYYIKKIWPNAISRYRADFLDKFELDIFIPEIKLAIEYDGVAWHKIDAIHKDREKRKYEMCQAHGIKLYRVKEKIVEPVEELYADRSYSVGNIENPNEFNYLLHSLLDQIDPRSNMWTRTSLANIHSPVDVNIERDRFEIMRYATQIKNSFADMYPELAKEWHPTKNGTVKPTMFRSRSGFKAWWKCKDCGREYEMSINHRSNGSGCPTCAIARGRNTLVKKLIARDGAFDDPVLLKEWNYEKNGNLTPDCFTKVSGKSVWWKCAKCGHEWQAKISNRVNGRGCPKCSGVKLIIGHNDLKTKNPNLLLEWDYDKNKGIDPGKIHYASNSRVWWRCSKCGYEYQAPIARRNAGSGCRKCADKYSAELRKEQTLKKRGSLAQMRPDLVKEYSDENIISADKVAVTSGDKVKWKCSVCGTEWMTAPYQRSVNGRGCPECGKKKSLENRKKKKSQNIKAVFIDIDNTILDFDAYVKETMREGFKEFKLKEYDDSMFDVFTKENDKFWRMIENKELTFEELKKVRWNTIFKLLGIVGDGEEFETYFRAKLNDSAILIDGAKELLEYLHKKYIVCAASNGPYKQQVKRLQLAGISEYVDYAFISEDVGASKPSEQFFKICLDRINETREDKITPDECIMIGDSITSDIVGGINAKMHTLLYERGNGKNNGLDVKADYTVTDLKEIKEIL